MNFEGVRIYIRERPNSSNKSNSINLAQSVNLLWAIPIWTPRAANEPRFWIHLSSSPDLVKPVDQCHESSTPMGLFSRKIADLHTEVQCRAKVICKSRAASAWIVEIIATKARIYP